MGTKDDEYDYLFKGDYIEFDTKLNNFAFEFVQELSSRCTNRLISAKVSFVLFVYSCFNWRFWSRKI